MQINTNRRNVTISGSSDVTRMSILGGSHIMRVLSDLYKNPVRSMVREYLTNMGDAMIAKGSTDGRPCEIRLPSTLDPTIRFIDWGVGMSMDTIKKVYAVYGASTKNQSNDEVGGFGLGAKTAYCYNEGQVWTIESYHNGTLHKFIAFVDDENIPSLMHGESTPTDEPNGVTISIPVKNNDIPQIESAVYEFAQFFPFPLLVDGKEAPKIQKDTSGNGWFLVDDQVNIGANESSSRSRGYSSYTVYVLMGGVPYGIDFYQFDLDYDFFLPVRSGSYYKKSLFLMAPIGSVEVVPSRDDLKYSEKTIKFIKSAIDKYCSEFRQRIKDRVIANSKTPYELSIKISEVFRDLRIHSSKSNTRDLFDNITCNGRTVTTYLSNFSLKNGVGFTIDVDRPVRIYSGYASSQPDITDIEDGANVPVCGGLESKTKFILDDLPKWLYSTCQGAYKKLNAAISIIVAVKDFIDPSASDEEATEALEAFIKEHDLQGVDVVYASDLREDLGLEPALLPGKDVDVKNKPTSPRRNNSISGITLYSYEKLMGSKFCTLSNALDPKETIYYFVCNNDGQDRFYMPNEETVHLYRAFAYKFLNSSDWGIERRQIVGVREDDVDKLPPHWKSFDSEVRDRAHERFLNAKDSWFYAWAKRFNNINSGGIYDVILEYGLEDADPDIKEFFTIVNAIEHDDISNYLFLCNYYQILKPEESISDHPLIVKVINIVERIRNKYPFIEHLKPYKYSDINYEPVANFIKSISEKA